LYTSIVAFNIAQFFPFLNYQLLPIILDKAGSDQKISKFFSNYLVNRKTLYLWNNFSFPFYNVGVGVGQELALSSILSALYLLLIFYILENHLKNLKIPIFFLSFVDNGLLISQSKSLSTSNTNLFYSYNVISNLLTKFSLVIEHNKTEVFHFSRLHGAFTSPPLDLSSLGGPCLLPKTVRVRNNGYSFISFSLLFYFIFISIVDKR